MENLQKLIAQLNPEHVKLNEPLSKHTTLKIGGPADIFFTPSSTDELVNAVKAAKSLKVPVTMLGWGANVLIADKGIRGLVIRNNSKNIEILGQTNSIETQENTDDTEVIARWASSTEEQGARKMYEFKDLNYDESDKPIVQVKMDSGVDLPFAINHLISKGITGLQWYSKIPGTIGGGIYNNIHGGTHFFNEILESVTILDEQNNIKTLNKSELGLGYDQSRFHNSKEIILSGLFNLRAGDKEKAQFTTIEWARRKGVLQPPISCGSVFQTLPNEEVQKRGYPTGSAGYVVEHLLKMTGFHIGDAWISEKHHNFIENKGTATAADYLSVINEIKTRAKKELDLDLKLEIFLLGEF